MPPGMMFDVSAEKLRAMTLPELKKFAQEIGISLAGLEDRESAVYTRLMQNAASIEPAEA